MWRVLEQMIEEIFKGTHFPVQYAAITAAVVVAVSAKWLWPGAVHLGATLDKRTQWVIVLAVMLAALGLFLGVRWLIAATALPPAS